MRQLRPGLNYANVIATLALFLALGGGAAYAADQLAKGSVGTKQLKRDAVTGAKVKNGSLSAGDFRPGQLPTGAPGPEGVRGLPGPPGATNVVVRYGEEGKPKEGEDDQSNAQCLPGEGVVGGGFDFLDGPENFNHTIQADRPSVERPVEGGLDFPAPADGTAARGWFVAMQNDTGATFAFRAYAMCARP
jgi:hypothetical protein